MSNDKKTNDTSNFMDILKKLWTQIVGFIGAVTLVAQFIQLWKGDQATVTYVTAALGAALVLFGLVWVAFGRKKYEVPDIADPDKATPKSEWRYSRIFRGIAIVGLFACFIGGAVGGNALIRHRQELKEKLVILIVTFDGPEETYAIADELQEQLYEAVADYEEIAIIRSKQTITVDQGQDVARKTGERFLADVVIWGWYRPTDNPNVTVHVENLIPDEITLVRTSQRLKPEASIAELESFELQQKVGEEMSALVLFLNGYAYYLQGDYEKALPRFEDALSIGEWSDEVINRSDALFFTGRIYYSQGRLEATITTYSQVIELDAEYTKAYNNRGVAYHDLGDYERAIADFTEAIELDPNDAFFYYNRGIAHYDLKKYEQAITDYTKAIELDPEYAKAYNNRGNAHMDLGENEQAVADYTQAIELDPEYAYAYYNRGYAYIILDEFEQAIADYTKTIELDPEHAKAYNNRGVAHENLEEYEQAIADYTKAIELDSQQALIYSNRGLVYKILGETNKAVEDFLKVIELSNDPNLIQDAKENLEELGQPLPDE